MAREYLNTPPTTMRRDDRAVDDDVWIKRFLHSAAVGVLATIHDGQPFINSNLFVYDEASHSIILHTAKKGRTRANVENENRVCFSIMQMGRLLPDEVSLEFSVEYGGIVIFGTGEMVEDEEEALPLLQLLMDKYAPHLIPGKDYRPPIAEELKRTSVFRVKIEEMSAKKKEVEEFEGAYWFPEDPVLESLRTRIGWQGQLTGIFIARESGSASQRVAEVEAVAGQGLRGDRYFGKAQEKPDEAAEVTLIAGEDLAALQHEHDFHLDPAQTRRNLLTEGVPLNYLVGKRFQIGEVILQGQALCNPCDSLAKLTGYGKPLITALLNRAGLRAKIIRGGFLRAGDVIQPVDA